MIKDLLDVIRKTETWKKALIALIILIAVIRFGYIAVKGEQSNKEIRTSTVIEEDLSYVGCNGLSAEFTSDSGVLDSVELMLSDIPEGNEDYLFIQIFNSQKPVYETEINLSNFTDGEWRPIWVNIKIDKGEKYKIVLSMTEESENIPTVLATNGGSTLAVNFISYEPASPAVRLIKAAGWIVFVFSAILLVILSELMKGKKTILDEIRDSKDTCQIVIIVLELVSLIAVISFSGMPFQQLTKISLIVISGIAVISYPKKSEYIRKLADKSWKKALLVGLYFYGAFAMVGQRILVYPFNKMPSLMEIIAFLCAVIWFVPVVNSFIWYFELLGQKVFSEKKKMNTILFIAIVTVILLVPLELYLYVYNPGISSVDTVDTMITNGKNIYGMFDWHPFFYCWVTMILTSIWDSPYMMVFSQQFMYVFILVELFLFLRRKGVRESVLIGCSVLAAVYVPNIILVTTIWKDVPYDLALLWMFVIVAKLVIDNEYYKKRALIYIELAAALTVTFLLRKNGFVPVIIVVALLIVLIIKNARILLSILMSFVLIFTFQFPMAAYYGVEKSSSTGVHMGLGQDILGVYYAGGELSNDTTEIVADMTLQNMDGYNYVATWSRGSYYIDASVPQFVVSYMDTFARNPLMTVRAVVAREDELWNIWQGDDMLLSCECYTGTMDGRSSEGYYWNDYYPAREDTSITSTLTEMNLSTARHQFMEAVTWRCGVFTMMALTTIVILIIKDKKKNLLTVLSLILGQILSLLLSTGWAEFRYYWGINLMNITFLMIAVLLVRRKTEEKEKKENA